ncbi:MAG: VWA domain-containing protein [Patescibacteria group bacterium]|nr:VWA domain-containing protein [Patescibacteria group bacterium]
MSQFTFRTSPPATYISPSRDEMKEAAKAVGLKGFAPDLVADMTNLAAGGRVRPPSEYRSEVARRVEEKLPAPDSNENWSITVRKDGKKTSAWTKNRQEAIASRIEDALRYHQNVCDFLQTLDLSKFPGNSPLEQAMSCLKLLSKKQGGESSGGAEGGGEPLPIFSENERPEGVAEALHETMDAVDSLSDEELDMVDPEGENHEVESEESDGQRQGHQGLNRLKVAEDLVDGSDKRVMLDISRKLDQFTKLQCRRQVKLETDPAGEEIRTRPIAHLGELSRVAKTAWATRQQNPSYFLYQAVTHQLPVRERVTRLEKKQAIFILVDGSGSMSGKKHWKATGVVMNRLKAVLSGDAEVYLSVFDTKMNRVEHAGTSAEARDLVKKFAHGNFSGGGTDIAAAVREAHKFIEEQIAKGAALYRPEVVVLTDDDTSVASLKKAEIPGTRVHGFAMECQNKSLVDFARSTGGVGIDKF